ncbi:hypothetical protein KCU92_g78, partial [Aureobasidium melanogenum]
MSTTACASTLPFEVRRTVPSVASSSIELLTDSAPLFINRVLRSPTEPFASPTEFRPIYRFLKPRHCPSTIPSIGKDTVAIAKRTAYTFLGNQMVYLSETGSHAS